MANIPAELQSLLEDMSTMDRTERTQMLLELSDEFEEVPESVASRPFPEDHRVPRCESEAYVWAEDNPDGTLKFHYAVENPQGVSARAVAAILDETLSGQPLENVAAVPEDIVTGIFGRELSMGKGAGLMGMVAMTTAEAKRRLKK